MRPARRGGGNQYRHRESEAYRKAVRRKLRAYHVFLVMGVAPTELAVKIALRYELPEFLLVGGKTNPIAKFIVAHQAPDCGLFQDKAA